MFTLRFTDLVVFNELKGFFCKTDHLQMSLCESLAMCMILCTISASSNFKTKELAAEKYICVILLSLLVSPLRKSLCLCFSPKKSPYQNITQTQIYNFFVTVHLIFDDEGRIFCSSAAPTNCQTSLSIKSEGKKETAED